MIYYLHAWDYSANAFNPQHLCEIRCAPSKIESVADKVYKHYQVRGADGKPVLTKAPYPATSDEGTLTLRAAVDRPLLEVFCLLDPIEADAIFPCEEDQEGIESTWIKPPAELSKQSMGFARNHAEEIVKQALDLKLGDAGATWTPAESDEERSGAFGVMELGHIGHLDYPFPHAIIRVTFLYQM